MSIRIGMIDYDRPSRPGSAEDVRQFLAVGGKDVIRLAWSSLNPSENNYIARDELASWFCDIFNLKRDAGQGNKCINILEKTGLLVRSRVGHEPVRPSFDL